MPLQCRRINVCVSIVLYGKNVESAGEEAPLGCCVSTLKLPSIGSYQRESRVQKKNNNIKIKMYKTNTIQCLGNSNKELFFSFKNYRATFIHEPKKKKKRALQMFKLNLLERSGVI